MKCPDCMAWIEQVVKTYGYCTNKKSPDFMDKTPRDHSCPQIIVKPRKNLTRPLDFSSDQN